MRTRHPEKPPWHCWLGVETKVGNVPEPKKGEREEDAEPTGSTAAARARAIELRRQGLSYQLVADQLDVSQHTVIRWTKGVPGTRFDSRYHPGRDEKIRRGYLGGESLREIAASVSASVKTVDTRIRKMGLPRNRKPGAGGRPKQVLASPDARDERQG